MQFSTLILALAATAAAIDIRGHTGDNCAGSYRACKGISPRTCCRITSSANSGRSSIAVVAIQRNWRIGCRGFTGGACRHIGGQRNSNGAATVCLPYTTRGDRTGGSYFFLNRKRAVEDECPAEQPDGENCEAVVAADTLGLEDGTEYDITSLSDEKIQELENIAASGAGADDVPAEFRVLQAEA